MAFSCSCCIQPLNCNTKYNHMHILIYLHIYTYAYIQGFQQRGIGGDIPPWVLHPRGAGLVVLYIVNLAKSNLWKCINQHCRDIDNWQQCRCRILREILVQNVDWSICRLCSLSRCRFSIYSLQNRFSCKNVKKW